jgi:hypothetical protein
MTYVQGRCRSPISEIFAYPLAPAKGMSGVLKSSKTHHSDAKFYPLIILNGRLVAYRKRATSRAFF